MSFILVFKREGYDPEYVGPFDTEDDAMSWGQSLSAQSQRLKSEVGTLLKTVRAA